MPKKKTSHMKKRHRQMAGKALKDVTALNKCSGCGHVKKQHHLCPYCIQGEDVSIVMLRSGLTLEIEIKKMWRDQEGKYEETAAAP